eukprot:gene23907-9475_t
MKGEYQLSEEITLSCLRAPLFSVAPIVVSEVGALGKSPAVLHPRLRPGPGFRSPPTQRAPGSARHRATFASKQHTALYRSAEVHTPTQLRVNAALPHTSSDYIAS